MILKVATSKIGLFAAYMFITIGSNGQCWNKHEVPDGFKINTVYELDSLTVLSQDTYAMLDHSISFIDSLEFDYSDTWLYYVIVLNSNFQRNDTTHVRVELLQGADYDPFFQRLPFEGDRFSGAFCYQGYTFFVLCDYNNMDTLFNTLFARNKKRDFYVYYKKPFVSQKWKDLGYTDLRFLGYYNFIYYMYENGKFIYSEMRGH